MSIFDAPQRPLPNGGMMGISFPPVPPAIHPAARHRRERNIYMNAFDRLEATRKLRRLSVHKTWVVFRTAVHELVASYNGIQEGQLNPAKIEEPSETSIIITSPRPSPNQFSSVSLVVRMTLQDQKCSILAYAQECLVEHGTPFAPTKFMDAEIVLAADPETKKVWLQYMDKRFSPQELAESLLYATLLHVSGEFSASIEIPVISPI